MHRTTIVRSTTGDTDILDLTPEVREEIARAGVERGWALLFVPGSTGGLTTLEFESGAVQDLKDAFERLAPRSGEYQHNLRWHDGNGYSHVRAALLGPSLTIPIADGEPALGTWQQIVLCDFDNRPREREVLLELLPFGAHGEASRGRN